jgi:hypothetical protein
VPLDSNVLSRSKKIVILRIYDSACDGDDHDCNEEEESEDKEGGKKGLWDVVEVDLAL